MKKKELKQRYKQLQKENHQYRNSLRYYQTAYYNSLDRFDDELEQRWREGYEEGHEAAKSLIEYARRRRVWYKLWL